MMKYYYTGLPVEIIGFETRNLGGKVYGKDKNIGRHQVAGMYIRFIDNVGGDGRSKKRWIRLDCDKFEIKEES